MAPQPPLGHWLRLLLALIALCIPVAAHASDPAAHDAWTATAQPPIRSATPLSSHAGLTQTWVWDACAAGSAVTLTFTHEMGATISGAMQAGETESEGSMEQTPSPAEAFSETTVSGVSPAVQSARRRMLQVAGGVNSVVSRVQIDALPAPGKQRTLTVLINSPAMRVAGQPGTTYVIIISVSSIGSDRMWSMSLAAPATPSFLESSSAKHIVSYSASAAHSLVYVPLCFSSKYKLLSESQDLVKGRRVQLGGFGSERSLSFRLMQGSGELSEEFTLVLSVAPASSAHDWSARIGVAGSMGANSILTATQLLEFTKTNRVFTLPAHASGQSTAISFSLADHATLSTPNPFIFTAPPAGHEVTLPFTVRAQSGLAITVQINVKVAKRGTATTVTAVNSNDPSPH